MKYLREFRSHSEYEAFLQGEGVDLPNVSLCDEEKDIHFNPMPTWESYIHDGLVFQLDGINKGGNEGYWTDLIGGIKLTPEGEPIENNNGFTFNGSNRFYHSARFPTNSEYTIEVCGKFQGGNAFFCGSWSEGAICLWGSRFMQAKANSPHNLFTNTQFSSSMNLDRCIKNGSSALTPTTTTMFNTGYTVLSVGKVHVSNDGLVGTINALRLYNRKLTEEEQRHNIYVDSKRYNFPLS